MLALPRLDSTRTSPHRTKPDAMNMVTRVTVLFALVMHSTLAASPLETWGNAGAVETRPKPLFWRQLQPPSMHVSDLVLALRWTGEMNRRLEIASKRISPPLDEAFVPRMSHERLRGGQIYPFRISGVRTGTTISTGGNITPPTIFHARAPRGDNPDAYRGAARWGPELQGYLRLLISILHGRDGSWASVSSDESTLSLELALAMIYMDRACSVDTPRDHVTTSTTGTTTTGSHRRCPFCTPRTVHRLLLCAMLLATEAVRGTEILSKLYQPISVILGIPLIELHQMMEWMRSALGYPGMHVSLWQMQEFTQTWRNRFGSTTTTTTSPIDMEM